LAVESAVPKYNLHSNERFLAMSDPLPFIVPGLIIVAVLLVICLAFGDE
jgi:hypothetical protein